MPALESQSTVTEPLPAKLSVLLVDDHTSIRQMLAFLIPREGPYEIIGQVSSGAAAIEKCRELKPRLVVLDLLLPGVNGVEVVRQVRHDAGDTRFLIYTGTSSNELVAEVMRQGPDGFVHKEDTLQEFRSALKTVTSGGTFFTALVNEMFTKGKAETAGAEILSERERLVLRLLAEGHGNKQIADHTNLAVKTVEHYRAAIGQKLGIHDVASLTRFALRHGLVTLQ